MRYSNIIKFVGVLVFIAWLLSIPTIIVFTNLTVMQKYLGETLGTVALYSFCFGWIPVMMWSMFDVRKA